jgi:hypothetical protein
VKVEAYELPGTIAIFSKPGIFFLVKERGQWRPVTDFGPKATIPLQDFPSRPLAIQSRGASDLDVEQGIAEGLLDPMNSRDWPLFPKILNELVAACLSSPSALNLVTERLSILTRLPDHEVGVEAARQLRALTGVCSEVVPVRGMELARELARRDFLSGKQPILPEPGSTDEGTTYWKLKAFSCSKDSAVRARAESFLRRLYPKANSVGCEICQE